MKATAVRLARVQDTSSALGLSMPGLSAILAGKNNYNISSIKIERNQGMEKKKKFRYSFTLKNTH